MDNLKRGWSSSERGRYERAVKARVSVASIHDLTCSLLKDFVKQINEVIILNISIWLFLLRWLGTVALLGLIYWEGGGEIVAHPEVLQLFNDEISAHH